MDITSFVLGYKKGKATGGGGGATVDPVHTVTFMSWDGSEVLGQRSVVDGDNCADMVARGEWETPTRESTDQYNYTYAGWSMTSGGAASSSALSAVTEDRTVYAAFTSAVRYYTISFYDDDGTLLTEKSVAYGSIPSYTPTKDGYDFNGWTPTPVAVTGDASYTATWNLKAEFETATWAQIKEICDAGNAASTFKLGDSRDEVLTFADGTTQTITLVVVGFDDRYVYDGNATPAEKSNLVLMTKNALNAKRNMSTDSKHTWRYSALRTYLNEDVYGALPGDLKTIIKQRDIVGIVGVYAGVPDYVWVPTLSDLGTAKKDFSSTDEKLSFFADNASRIKKLGNNGAATTYWTSSWKQSGTNAYYAYIASDGAVYGGETSNAGYASPSSEHGVVFGVII